VIVPKNLLFDNISIVELTGKCNHDPKDPKPYDFDVLAFDEIAKSSGVISVVLY
jgi:hypothetical protein